MRTSPSNSSSPSLTSTKSALPPLLPSPPTKPLPPVKKLSAAEMQLRREKGLCFTCDDKFSWKHVRIAYTWFCRWMNRMAMFPPLLSPNLFHRIFRRMILQLCIICHYKLIMALMANVLSTFLGRLQAPPCAFFSMVAVLTTSFRWRRFRKGNLNPIAGWITSGTGWIQHWPIWVNVQLMLHKKIIYPSL